MRTRSNGKKWLLCWKRLLPWCIAEHAAYLAQLGSHTKPALREPLPPAVQTEHGDSTLPAKTISLDEQTGAEEDNLLKNDEPASNEAAQKSEFDAQQSSAQAHEQQQRAQSPVMNLGLTDLDFELPL
eukprot:m.96097 g.96097  ORF g.96097 m.96097 type:complete len:127 (+) comp51316_c0_seq1:418-798(+)